MTANGTSRQFAAARQFGRNQSEADIEFLRYQMPRFPCAFENPITLAPCVELTGPELKEWYEKESARRRK